MVSISPNISIITVNAKIQLYLIYKEPIKYNNIDRLKVKGWKKRYHAYINQRKKGVFTLILVKVDFEKIKLPDIES